MAQLNRSSTVQPEKWGSGTGDGGEPHRERKWKENRQGGCKCQWITPSSSVNLGTLCVGMADAASSVQPVTSTCLSSSTPLRGHLFSLPPCHFQISSLHSHPLVTADQLPCLYSDPPAPSLATYSSKIHLLKRKALPGPPLSADSSLCQHLLHLEALWHAAKCLTHSWCIQTFFELLTP